MELMPRMPEATFDLIFADPPYFLSNDGITCHAGKMVSVNKGMWDKSKGAAADHAFTLRWLSQCQRLLKPNGTIWVSGTMHVIHNVGFAMQELGFKLLNDITWVKPNPPPNLSCRYFTHATETIIWAGRDSKCRHRFNYALMKHLNGGRQMTSVWTVPAPRVALSRLMLQHPLVRLARQGAASVKTREEQQAAVASLLQRCTCLAQTTCLRRAQTLLAWLSWAAGSAPLLEEGCCQGHVTPNDKSFDWDLARP
jgi:site-specific DNA-methyltransferase (adenine-specific)